MRYEITIKEVGRDNLLTTSHNGLRSRKEVIDFFGLEEKDVEWYKIEELDEED